MYWHLTFERTLGTQRLKMFSSGLQFWAVPFKNSSGSRSVRARCRTRVRCRTCRSKQKFWRSWGEINVGLVRRAPQISWVHWTCSWWRVRDLSMEIHQMTDRKWWASTFFRSIAIYCMQSNIYIYVYRLCMIILYVYVYGSSRFLKVEVSENQLRTATW